MAAPPDPEKEPRRHWAPIAGIIVVVLVVLLGFAWWLQDETSDPDMPGQEAYEEVTPPEATGPIEPIGDAAETGAENDSAP